MEGVRLPDGSGAFEAGATVKARCVSVPVAPGEVPAAWRSVPISVTVFLEGYRVLTFEFLLDGDAVARVMEPAE